METTAKNSITVQNTVNVPIAKAWQLWSGPQHITQWNSPSDDWHTPMAVNDLITGGRFNSRMEARDGSIGFDFEGTYDEVRPNEYIAYTIADGRKVSISFKDLGNATHISETFETENIHPVEMQRGGWQAILDSFKKYAESL